MNAITLQEAILLGKMAEFTTHGEQPFSIAAQGLGLPPTTDAILGIFPWLLREDLQLNCCEKELEYGKYAYCRLAHWWDAHEFKTMEEFCAIVSRIEPVIPWKDEAEHIEWLKEQVTEVLQKEREIRAVPQGDGEEGDAA
jgi:hypothetical protein